MGGFWRIKAGLDRQYLELNKMKILVLLAVVAGCLAMEPNYYTCDGAEATFVYGADSGTGDDDESVTAGCPAGTLMAKCVCEGLVDTNADCDGEYFLNQIFGTFCVARNMAGGGGVKAKGTCYPVQLTCTTPRDVWPAIKCPENYKKTGCTLHMDTRHDTQVGSVPKSHFDPPFCTVTKHQSCDNGSEAGLTPGGRCQVQAQCVRHAAYFT